MRAILHIGAAKCGTTAIQTALGTLRPQLDAAGLRYPSGYGATEKSPRTGALIHGNAVALGWLLDPNINSPHFDRVAVNAWLQECIAEAEGRDLLFSSEIMQMPHHPHASDLTEVFARAGYDVHIVYYVRHAIDQAIAVFLQVLKRGRLLELGWAGMEDYLINHATCPYESALAAFGQVLPRERFMVRLFDAERGGLVAAFLRLLTDHVFDIPQGERVINRSPSAAEQEVFAALTRQENGPRLCRIISDHLMSQPLATPLQHTVSEAALAAYTARNQGVIDRMNATYPSLGGGLQIKSDRIAVGPEAAPPAEEVYAVFTRCLQDFAEKWALPAARQAGAQGAARRALGLGPGPRQRPVLHDILEHSGLLPEATPLSAEASSPAGA